MNWKSLSIMMMTAGHLYAWNSMGHRLVAQIAIDQLPSGYVKKLSHLNHQMDAIYPPRKLVNSATWMDDIRFDDNQWYTDYHYEDDFFSDDDTALPTKCGHHASWAIQTAVSSLENKNTTPINKAMSLRILLHVIGDIHQPLHAIAKVSRAYPQGDAGGNHYLLNTNPIGRTLHQYWDNGGGYLIRHHPVRYSDIVKVARQIERKYPCHSLPIGKVNIPNWLRESYRLGLERAYKPLKGGMHIPPEYQSRTQKLSQYQIALAGCRLAKILKQTQVNYDRPSWRRME